MRNSEESIVAWIVGGLLGICPTPLVFINIPEYKKYGKYPIIQILVYKQTYNLIKSCDFLAFAHGALMDYANAAVSEIVWAIPDLFGNNFVSEETILVSAPKI